jgi:hypothetical protein
MVLNRGLGQGRGSGSLLYQQTDAVQGITTDEGSGLDSDCERQGSDCVF